MGFRKLGAAIFVAAVLSVVLASSALAAAVTEDVKWYTGEAPGTELTGAETISAEAVGTTTFTTEVGETKYKLEATGVKCVECKIENSAAAVGSGKLTFTGVKVLEPAGCSVASELTTTALSVSADWMAAAKTEPNYWKFTPTKGETTAFATIEVTGCPLSTTIVPKGSLGFQDKNSTGTGSVFIQLSTSGAIQAAAGFSLKSGTKSFTSPCPRTRA
jgi:hypothetical protein